MESLDSLDRVSAGILMGRDGETARHPSVWSKSAVSIPKQIFQLERWFASVKRQAGRSIRFSIRHAPTNGVFGWVDEVLLERFLMNTVQNAIESPGVESISIDSRLDGDRVELRVRDDGRGCPSEILSKINSGVAVTGKEDGHGFGLSGPVEGLRNDGAEVRFESEVGMGFCAIIRIPLASPKVVLVDDDRAIRLVWRTLARAKGIDFHALEPTDEALEQLLAHEDRKTEIFVDLHLGDRSGVGVLEALQKAGFERLFLASAEPELAPDPSAFPVRNKEFPRSSL
jgi:CheY-like chemotaxis protein